MVKKLRTSDRLAWIEHHAFIGERARQVLAFQANLEASQWWPRARIAQFQEAQLARLLDHARDYVPRYRTMLDGIRIASGSPVDWCRWRQLPLLTREQVQNEAPTLRASALPAGHDEFDWLRSSGSTGRAVEVVATNVSDLWQKVLTLRAQIWAARDFTRTMGVIRKLPSGEALAPDGDALDQWGDGTTFPFLTGPCVRLTATTEIGEQRAWLERRRPKYLTTYPSILHALANQPSNESLAVQGVSTLGETLEQELRELIDRRWHCRLFDVYSAEEVGCMAIECPETGGYHVQAEAALVEVLKSDGEPCEPGEAGEVVVTPLYNYAMPLLRYAIGDFAEAGGRCRCGRGLPLINRILGRRRNMLTLADGRTYWPSFGTRGFARIAPVLQQQFHQSALDRLDVRLVVAEPLNENQEAALRGQIQKALPVSFQIVFEYVDQIPRNDGGKFELFTSAIDSGNHQRSAITSA